MGPMSLDQARLWNFRRPVEWPKEIDKAKLAAI